MLDTRAILLAAAAIAGFSAGEAQSLTPLSIDLAVDPSITEGPAEHATLAPRSFERAPDDAYEATARVTNPRARMQCVPFARQESGVELYGNANTWWTQARERYETAAEPAEGAVMVMRGYRANGRGHVAVVREVVSSRLVIVDHANWLNGGEITRDVPVRDVSAAGDWSEVQVWHIPTQQWGARKYGVQGFILNLSVQAGPETSTPLG